jgi:hypothetical protein
MHLLLIILNVQLVLLCNTVPFFNAGHRDLHAKNLGSVNELFSRSFWVGFGGILDWYFINQFQFGPSYKTK